MRAGNIVYTALGAWFGFLLSRAGATTSDHCAGLFLLRDPQLLWVIGVAAGTGLVGVALLQWLRPVSLLGGQPLSFAGKPFTRGLIPGSVLFGLGWGLSAACPGTALAMLGEGKLASLFTVVGILLGTWLYGWQQDRAASARPPSSQPVQGAM